MGYMVRVDNSYLRWLIVKRKEKVVCTFLDGGLTEGQMQN